MSDSRRDLYAEYLALLVSEVEQLLGRALTDSERHALWEVKSLLRLEQLTDDLERSTHTSADAEVWIRRIVQGYTDQ